jgi:hypothetical protein
VRITANPQWNGIQHKLLPGQVASDRPYLVCSVFKLKKALLKDIMEGNVFVRFQGQVWTILYQQRGLLYKHLLTFLHWEFYFLDLTKVDEVIGAEIPSSDFDSTGELSDIVNKVFVYGPLGAHNLNASCMVKDANTDEAL